MGWTSTRFLTFLCRKDAKFVAMIKDFFFSPTSKFISFKHLKNKNKSLNAAHHEPYDVDMSSDDEYPSVCFEGAPLALSKSKVYKMYKHVSFDIGWTSYYHMGVRKVQFSRVKFDNFDLVFVGGSFAKGRGIDIFEDIMVKLAHMGRALPISSENIIDSELWNKTSPMNIFHFTPMKDYRTIYDDECLDVCKQPCTTFDYKKNSIKVGMKIDFINFCLSWAEENLDTFCDQPLRRNYFNRLMSLTVPGVIQTAGEAMIDDSDVYADDSDVFT